MLPLLICQRSFTRNRTGLRASASKWGLRVEGGRNENAVLGRELAGRESPGTGLDLVRLQGI